jgi:hypothetical protein
MCKSILQDCFRLFIPMKTNKNMTKLRISFVAVLLSFLYVNTSNGQGCSDAGFCTIDSFKPHTEDSAKALSNQIKIGAFYGKADNNIIATGGYLEYNRQLNDKLGLDAKLTTLAQNGNGISTFGVSDLFLNAKYKATGKLNLTLGTKVPLNKADASQDGLPLPMDYQSSLGTFDVVFGVGYVIKKIQIVAAIQQPLTQNDNQFLASEYAAESKLSKFQSTNQFKRSGDVMLRVFLSHKYRIKI